MSFARQGRVTLLDTELCVPTRPSPTHCRVLARALPDGSGPPVVLVVDSAANAGVSAHLVFDQVVRAARRLLPPGSEEPIWIHRWDERAVASLVLHDEPVARDHVMQLATGGWESWPIPARVTRLLLR